MEQARRWLVRGRVQGVGFRYFVERCATLIGVRGWVRNLDDGRVETYAVGSRAQLDELAGHLWQGPRWAEVQGVDELEASIQRTDGFRIRHD